MADMLAAQYSNVFSLPREEMKPAKNDEKTKIDSKEAHKEDKTGTLEVDFKKETATNTNEHEHL